MSQRSNSTPAGRPGLRSLPGLGKGSLEQPARETPSPEGTPNRWSLLGPRALKEYKSFPEICAFPLEPVGGSYAGHREVRKLALVTRGFSTCYKPVLNPALRPRRLCSALHHSEKHMDSEDPYQSHCARIYLPNLGSPFLDLEIL